MKARTAFGFTAILCVLALPAFAGGKADLQKYLSDAAARAKATANTAEKRQILDESFRVISKACEIAKSMPFVSKSDVDGITRLQGSFQAKQDELVGANGYTRVPDTQLNAFSNYIVQDMEQADEVITISLVTLVIIVLVILILV